MNVLNETPAPVRESPHVYSIRHFLTAGEADARGEMPVSLAAERMIEAATMHANELGIGYAALTPRGVAWVLSRLVIEMPRVPRINEKYVVTTWIESWNRLFSERCFMFSDEDGRVYGYGRSTWATIDIHTRKVSELTDISRDDLTVPSMVCPIAPFGKHRPVTPSATEEVTFRYSDLDFNRHVNSVRYIEHILDLWSPRHYDIFRPQRFEIAYSHECKAGDKVSFLVDDSDPTHGFVEIMNAGVRAVSSRIYFQEDPILPEK